MLKTWGWSTTGKLATAILSMMLSAWGRTTTRELTSEILSRVLGTRIWSSRVVAASARGLAILIGSSSRSFRPKTTRSPISSWTALCAASKFTTCLQHTPCPSGNAYTNHKNNDPNRPNHTIGRYC